MGKISFNLKSFNTNVKIQNQINIKKLFFKLFTNGDTK